MSATFGVGARLIPAGGGGFAAVALMPGLCGERLGCSAGDVRLGVCVLACKALWGDVD